MSEVSSARPLYLWWCDLETTGLVPSRDLILELAWRLTQFAYPFDPIADRQATGRFVSAGRILIAHDVFRVAALMNDVVAPMHEKSGLMDDIRRAFRRDDAERATDAVIFAETGCGIAPSVTALEDRLLAMSAEWPGIASGASKEEKDQKVVIAGSSVHFDLGFLRVHMPRFAKRLSHRIFDASVLSLACRSLGRPAEAGPRSEAAHRAAADLEGSIRIAKECVGWLECQTVTQY